MTTMVIGGPQRRAARIAALAYLLSFVTVVSVNFGIFTRLIVGADPAQTAKNIVAHETLFRAGLAGAVFYGIAVCCVSAALYVVLNPVDQLLAMLAALGRVVHAFTWLLITVNLFTALRLLSRPEYARAFPPDQLAWLARPYLSGFDQYYVGLLFWSLSAAVGACLWLKSGYIPRALAGFGVVASTWCAACTVALYLFPDFQKLVNLWWFDTPMVLFEISLSVLLLFRGLRMASAAG